MILPWHSQNCSAVFCPYKGGEEIGGIENTEKSRELIVKFVQEWNSKMIYNKSTYSCQIFVKKLVERLGLNQDFFAHDCFIERFSFSFLFFISFYFLFYYYFFLYFIFISFFLFLFLFLYILFLFLFFFF